MQHHPVVSQGEWLAARKALLLKEKKKNSSVYAFELQGSRRNGKGSEPNETTHLPQLWRQLRTSVSLL
jgi:hypothetical protein